MIPLSPSVSFWESVSDTQWQEHWGTTYDQHLMAALVRLDDAEEIMKLDWQEIERQVEAGELKREYWDHMAASKALESARAEYWIAHEQLAKDHTPAEVHKIIAEHYGGIAEYRLMGKRAKVKSVIIIELEFMLIFADGSSPCVTRVADLIEALKACAPLFIPETGADAKRKLRKAHELRPLLRTIENLAEQGWDKAGRAEYFEGIARYIHEEGLFRGAKTNVEKKIRAAAPLMKGGLDKSSSLHGQPKRDRRPCKLSDS